MAKVSIVLPVYNGERYLKESIESIISQTYVDWELIIVDDCSTDMTNSIANYYVENDERIFLIRNNHNMKLPGALNTGFDIAKGEFLTWTSDDNTYHRDAIGMMVDKLEKDYKASMVVANMEYIDEIGNTIGLADKFIEENMYYYNCLGACFMYKKIVLDTVGKYDEELYYVEDYDYWLRIINKCGEIRHIDSVLYRYRVHVNSLSNNVEKVLFQQQKFRLKHLEEIVNHYKYNSSMLIAIYQDFMAYDYDDLQIVKNKLISIVPEVEMIVDLDLSKDIILYGAGDYGNKAYNCLGEKARYYADSDYQKIGKIKNGLKILAIEELRELYETGKYQIVVSVSKTKVYKILNVLNDNRISKCAIWGNNIKWMRWKEE